MIKKQRGAIEAEDLLEDLGIDSLPVDPFEIASLVDNPSFRVVFNLVPYDAKSILGKAIGNDSGAVVDINSNIPDEGRLNFTAAHELGHVCMHIMPGSKTSFECGKQQLQSSHDDPFEKEANEFASALLMPEKLINELTDKNINWKNIKHIKDICKTSLESTFRRLSTIYSEPCALIIHKNGKFTRFVTSPYFEVYIERNNLSDEQLKKCANGLNNEFFSSFEESSPSGWVKPKVRSYTLQKIYTSSVSLSDGFVYTLIKYNDKCLN
ncbi:ImmA/IrrE family metallo-endopeptidase [Shewanella amazonensis]|uniref:IrrE N-terminal-like domain-containing protein n=1 Tax=Shewanella amazonensis (strain ATCC BAA-1098 / SB2B) TaxID=326297 RepID=A1S964_SHEAM|nr:ImmA/IrrE family metallo-endopeptidase [Shewanella amazonensis]ABM00921.1 hypothetical protein Sama_2718 [Shewanella amazonensis SB2B]